MAFRVSRPACRGPFILVLMFVCTAYPAPQVAAPEAPERAALHIVVQTFLDAFAREDVPAVLALWSDKSPQREAYKQSCEKEFASKDFKFGAAVLSRVSLTDSVARLRASVPATVTGLHSRYKGEQQIVRDVELARERGGWKVWKCTSPADELAIRVANAGTEEQREKLLSEDPDLQTIELIGAMTDEAGRRTVRGEYPVALSILRIAYDIAQRLHDGAGSARALNGMGRVYIRQADHKQAMEHFRKSMALAEQAGDAPALATALRGVGNVNELLGEYTEGLTHLERSLKICTEVGDQEGVSAVLLSIGNIYLKRGSYSTALDYYSKSLSTAEATGSKEATVFALSNIAAVHFYQGEYKKALDSYHEVRKAHESLGNRDGLALTLNNIGAIYLRQADHARALEYMHKSEEMFQSLGAMDRIAALLDLIGSVHYSQGAYEEALDYFSKSLALAEKLGLKAQIAIASDNIGTVYHRQGNHVKALRCYERSMAISKEAGNEAGVAIELNNIANVYHSQANNPLALEYYRHSLAISERIGFKPGMADTLGNIGGVEASSGNYGAALDYLTKSLAATEGLGDTHGIARTTNNIGEVFEKQSRYAEALDYFSKSTSMAEASHDVLVLSTVLANTARVHQKAGRYEEALTYADRATTLAQTAGLREVVGEARHTAGQAYIGLEKVEEARRALRESIASVEALRGHISGGEQELQSYFEGKVSPYHSMVDLLIREANFAEALRIAEQAKSRSLAETLLGGRTNVTKAMTAEERKLERELNGRLRSLGSQIYRERAQAQPDQTRVQELTSELESARLEYESFERRLYVAHPELQVHRGESPPIGPEEAASLLPDAQTALLEFVVAQEKTHLLVVTGRRTPSVRAYVINIGETELAGIVERFRRMLASVDGRFTRLGGELYDLLLKPAADQLAGTNRLIVVPDGPLWELPMQALITPGMQFVIEKYTISYAPSLTVLREMVKSSERGRESSSAVKKLLAVGNPALGKVVTASLEPAVMDSEFEPLPEAERQVRFLATLYPRGQTKAYVGAEAREDRFKAEAANYEILHLATHGVLNDHSPMYSHLLLAQTSDTQGDDGLLEARELMALNLKADLAVLSACETARGRVRKGEGMIGLTWALFVAGVPTTVVSQWKVRADSTADLMVGFHRQLRTQSRLSGAWDAATALRTAALKVKKNPRYRHPFYWAGFVVIGRAGQRIHRDHSLPGPELQQ